MKLDPLLSKAAGLAKKHKYEEALKILKDEEDRYSGLFKYYYLYAVICLHSGSFVEAHEYFHSARQQKMKDPGTLLGLALCCLRELKTARALDYYLDVQEADPKNRIAKRALAAIRKNSDPEALSEWMTPKKLEKLYPPIPGPLISPKTIFNAVLILAAASVITLGILIGVKVLPNPFKKQSGRQTSEFVLSGEERKEAVETGGSYRYILTLDQATGLYDRALSLFTEYRDEEAKVNLNRILESNASEVVKNKSRLLVSYMEVPGFDTFKRNFNPSFSEVKNEPFIYRDVHIIWRGMATNVEVTDEHTRFDFLIGYDTRRTLEGIVQVTFYSPVSINSERPLEVLGRIKLVSSYPQDIVLEGVAIYQSGRLEEN
jgi:tetratricopeptide (TPR) repeat protein